MPCHYPEGSEEDWCERHARDAAMLRALREESAVRPPVLA
jgi:hypothetical protein